MGENETESTGISLEEERLQLAREALVLERERLNAARTRVEAEAHLSRKANRPVLVYSLIVLLAAASFFLGFLAGRTHEQTNRRRWDDQRREQQLTARDGTAEDAGQTAGASDGETPAGGHRKVSSVVFH